MTSEAETTADALQEVYNRIWDNMEWQFKQTFNVAISDRLPELSDRFAGEFREVGGHYQKLVEEMFGADEDGIDTDSETEIDTVRSRAADPFETFLKGVTPRSTYNANILRCFVHGWRVLQCARAFLSDGHYFAATYLLCEANSHFGVAEGMSSCRDASRQIASKAGRKRHERSPEIKRAILERYRKEISPEVSAAQAALELHAKGVPYNIEGLMRIIREERKRRLATPS